MAKALVGLVEKMPRKRPAVTEEEPDLEGEPEDSPVGAGGDDAEEPEDKGFGDHANMALDDLADICGVSPEDRGDFGAAMTAFVHAVVGDALRGDDGEEPDEGGGEPQPHEETEEEPEE